MDIEIFTLLKVQAIEVFAFLLIVRDFANGKGLQQDVDRINASIAENKHILAIANNQICDLKKLDINNRMGFFDTINPL